MRPKFSFLHSMSAVVCAVGLIRGEPAGSLADAADFEDEVRAEPPSEFSASSSPTVDFLQIPSSLDPSIRIAIVVHKPARPGPIVLKTHGWHQSVKPPAADESNPHRGYLTVAVDMRGRAFSSGRQDCNGYELHDVYDALNYVRLHYAAWISNPQQAYFYSSSGGGGNALAIAGKFPDLFCAVVAFAPISDYARWYQGDLKGEFRDEMHPWIGGTPVEKPIAYANRGGLTSSVNVLSPLYLAHGETDVRVPSEHSRRMVAALRALGKPVHYLEFPGVGTRAHWGNATEVQMRALDQFRDDALSAHSRPPELPRYGQLLVPGYVVTRHFSVYLSSMDEQGVLVYSLDDHYAELVSGAGRIEWHDNR